MLQMSNDCPQMSVWTNQSKALQTQFYVSKTCYSIQNKLPSISSAHLFNHNAKAYCVD